MMTLALGENVVEDGAFVDLPQHLVQPLAQHLLRVLAARPAVARGESKGAAKTVTFADKVTFIGGMEVDEAPGLEGSLRTFEQQRAESAGALRRTVIFQQPIWNEQFLSRIAAGAFHQALSASSEGHAHTWQALARHQKSR